MRPVSRYQKKRWYGGDKNYGLWVTLNSVPLPSTVGMICWTVKNKNVWLVSFYIAMPWARR